MATLTLEYDSRNKTARQIMDGLLLSGVFVEKNIDKPANKLHIKKHRQTVREKHIADFKEAIRQTEEMVCDIRKNGTKGYQTMDEFLKTKNYKTLDELLAEN
jgi:hypothetical protein